MPHQYHCEGLGSLGGIFVVPDTSRPLGLRRSCPDGVTSPSFPGCSSFLPYRVL